MKKLVKDFSFVRYYYEGKRDIWGNKVLTRYEIDSDGKEIEGGFVYKRNKGQIKMLQKEYGPNVGVQEFTHCPKEFICTI